MTKDVNKSNLPEGLEAVNESVFGFPTTQALFFKKIATHDAIPPLEPAYVFVKQNLKILQLFMSGAEKNILLTGDTGCGKTSLIEQVAARLNWPVFAIGCHGGLDFQELIGRVTLKPDGSTGWADGPLISAMRVGGVFLLDEMNFLKPEVAGGLNTILQASVYMIPETGEIIKAHRDFRIAATGNAIDGVGKGAYRGTQTPNIALLNRFTLGIHMDYMSIDNEAKMIQAKASKIVDKVANFIAEIADMSRKNYRDGSLKSPISPRETISLAKRLVEFSGGLVGVEALNAQMYGFMDSMEMTFLYRWQPEDKIAFMESTNSVAKRFGLSNLLNRDSLS